MSFKELYQSNTMLHCTAMYAGFRSENSVALEYAENENTRNATGKCFVLRLLGIIITPRTVGCRVVLDKHELLLWANDDSPPKEDSKHGKDGKTDGEMSEKRGEEPESEMVSSMEESCPVAAEGETYLPEKDVKPVVEDSCSGNSQAYASCASSASENDDGHLVDLPPGSRAHVTLGCSMGVEAVQTGFDQLEVLQCERDGKRIGEPVKVDHITISYYGEGRCTVYFDNALHKSSLFSGQY